jgi:ribosomal protein S18 acetylase RimI-like enzyme
LEKIEVYRVDRSSRVRWFEEAADVYEAVGKMELNVRLLQIISATGFLAAAVNSTGDVVGAVTAFIWGSVQTREANIHLQPDRQLRSDPPLFFISDAAVLQEWQGQGVGETMIQTLMDDARFTDNGEKMTRFISLSRSPLDGGKSSRNLFLRLGYVEIGSYGSGYYAGDAFRCPSCRGRCECEARLLIKEASN